MRSVSVECEKRDCAGKHEARMFFCVQAQARSQGLPCPEQKSRSRFRERLSIPYSPRVVQSRLVLVAQRTETRDGEGRE